MSKETMKAALQAQIQTAREYLDIAQQDIEREDRIDALDMLHMAQHRIEETRQRITATLPEVLR